MDTFWFSLQICGGRWLGAKLCNNPMTTFNHGTDNDNDDD